MQDRSALLTILSYMNDQLFHSLDLWPDFKKFLKGKCLLEWIVPQRIHPLRSMDNTWILREDESGFGMSGTKRRKMASIIPWLLKEQVQQLVVIGGANSNHVVTAVQACRERGIRPVAFLLEGRGGPKKGNAFLIDLLLEEEDIHWISREKWPEVEAIARAWAGTQTLRTEVLSEGGAHPAAIPGAATLPLTWADQRGRCPYDHVWIDSGTGISAITAILMCGKLGWSPVIHVVLMAGDELSFRDQLRRVQLWWGEELGAPIPDPCPFVLHIPPTARSFGAVNAGVWEEVRRVARKDGILSDPVYVAKLLLTVRKEALALSGRHLVVHSGGGIGLLGFG